MRFHNFVGSLKQRISMAETHNWNSVPQCRLCGKFGAHKMDIVDDNPNDLWEKIMHCVGIRVEKSDKSTKICLACFIEINNFTLYRQLCAATDIQMRISRPLNCGDGMAGELIAEEDDNVSAIANGRQIHFPSNERASKRAHSDMSSSKLKT